MQKYINVGDYHRYFLSVMSTYFYKQLNFHFSLKLQIRKMELLIQICVFICYVTDCYCDCIPTCILVEKRRNIKNRRPATKLETAHCLMFIPIQLKRTMAGTHYISAQIYYISVSEVMYSIFL